MNLQLRFLMVWLLLLSGLFANDTPWAGKWHVSSPYATYVLQLEQKGDHVQGSYQPGNGILKGKIAGNTLHAETTADNNLTNILNITMGNSEKSFFGDVNDRTWIAAILVDKDKRFNDLRINLSSPLSSLYSFLTLGNGVRTGNYEALEKAMDILQFSNKEQVLRHPYKFDSAQTFFYILDECMLRKIDFIDMHDQEIYSVKLQQYKSDVTVTVDFVKDKKTDEWKIQLPEKSVLKQKLALLLKERGTNDINPNENLELKDPRAAMRTFVEQYDRWHEGGKKYVISTMNLSDMDPAIHEWQAPLLAFYLKSVLDRLSYVMYQEIPNDPKSKKPYVFFHHAMGNIVIAPYEIDGKVKWQFTPQTLDHIDDLYYEMENIKPRYETKTITENNLYFLLKSVAKNISPLLLTPLYHAEVWQDILFLLIILIALILSFIIRYAVLYGFKKFFLTKRWTEEMIRLRYIRPMQLTTFGVVLLYGAHQLGLSNVFFSSIKMFTHLLIVIGMAWIIYNLITVIISVLTIEVQKTSTNVDEIILSLVGSMLRITVIVVAVFLIAEIFAIPYQTVLAGLGIGGLAFAIAAKDTIANLFGSAIIIADRPFKTGDLVKIGADLGWITDVGIRSTKIRTIYDTMLTVPNNMITSTMIDNYSARDAMRIDTEFLLGLETSRESLDNIDSQISQFLKENKDVDNTKIILTGVNDYTNKGISFGVNFFVKTSTPMEYSTARHRLVTDIAQIIKENKIELLIINYEVIENKVS